jgi:hypothetical protein
VGEAVEHGAARGIAEGAEDEIESVVRLVNHEVEYRGLGRDCQLVG